MNDDDIDLLQRELERLKPTVPDEALMRRLRASRKRDRITSAEPERSFAERFSRWLAEWWWLPAGATTVLVGGLILGLRGATPPHDAVLIAGTFSRHVFTPEKVDNYLVEARDLGVFVGDDNRPYKLVRATWVDEADYRGDDGASRMLFTGSRDQLIPVALEVY